MNKYFNSIIGKFQENLKIFSLIYFLILVLNISGCGWLIVGGGTAYEGYKVGSDPRSIGTQIDDATITAKVKLKLIEDPITKARKIDVDTVNGVVTLTGIVESENQKKKAIEHAKSVSGVVKVIDNLQIKK